MVCKFQSVSQLGWLLIHLNMSGSEREGVCLVRHLFTHTMSCHGPNDTGTWNELLYPVHNFEEEWRYTFLVHKVEEVRKQVLSPFEGQSDNRGIDQLRMLLILPLPPPHLLSLSLSPLSSSTSFTHSQRQLAPYTRFPELCKPVGYSEWITVPVVFQCCNYLLHVLRKVHSLPDSRTLTDINSH